MLRRFVVRWQLEIVLAGMFVAYLLVGLTVHGCGGGGGGARPTQPPTQQSIRSVVETTARSTTEAMKSLRKGLASFGRRFRQDSCPAVTSNWYGTGPLPNPLVVKVDYGSGCEDEEGDFFKGSLTLTLRDPRIDEEGDLNVSGLSISFNNFSDGEETISGTFSLSETETPSIYRLTYDLRYSNIAGCNERMTFNGTLKTDVPIDEDFTEILLTGTGSYSGPSGNFKLEATDLLWDLTTDCEYPEGGILKVTAGGVTATITFSEVCRQANVAFNGGAPSVVSLPDLDEDDPTDPCF